MTRAGDLSHHAPMTDLDRLIADAETYADKAGLSISTVSRQLFGDGTRIRKMKAGQTSALSRTIERAGKKLRTLNAALGNREAA